MFSTIRKSGLLTILPATLILSACGDADASASSDGSYNTMPVFMEGPTGTLRSAPVGKMELFRERMGSAIFIVNNGKGSSFSFECGEFGKGVHAQIGGKGPPQDSKVTFDVDGDARTLHADDLGNLNTDNKIGMDAAISLWNGVRGGKLITVKFRDGRNRTFGLGGASKLMGMDYCMAFPAGRATNDPLIGAKFRAASLVRVATT